jgi:hypothetical protein
MKKFIITSLILISNFFIELNEVYSYTCVQTSSYTMESMGWLVRRFTCTAIHPITGATVIWRKIVVSDGNGGTLFEDEEFNRKVSQPVENIMNSHSFLVYPNPANQYIYLTTFKTKDSKINVTLYDLQLRNVALLYDDLVSSDQIRISLPSLPSGNYFITINDGFSIVSKPISIIN